MQILNIFCASRFIRGVSDGCVAIDRIQRQFESQKRRADDHPSHDAAHPCLHAVDQDASINAQNIQTTPTSAKRKFIQSFALHIWWKGCFLYRIDVLLGGLDIVENIFCHCSWAIYSQGEVAMWCGLSGGELMLYSWWWVPKFVENGQLLI